MSQDIPGTTRVYHNHHLDSTRWEEYQPREGDIIVTTAYKAGTTWTQQILYEMFFGRLDPRPDFKDVSPWPDARFPKISRDQLAEQLETIPGRRYIKSHLPLDGLPYYEQVEYFIVARDPRDVFMSFYNHYSRYTETALSMMNAPGVEGDPLPPCPKDPRELWREWINRGWFEWESEGYPFWANLGHTASYWGYRHLSNFHFFHYNDMLKDPSGAVRRMASAASFKLKAGDLERVLKKTNFDYVKTIAREMDSKADPFATIFEGGSDGFFHKGTNGRWKNLLTENDLMMYQAAKARVLTDECAEWLELGGEIK